MDVLMQRVNNPFWVDVFKHFKKLYLQCIPVSCAEFVSECLHYNANITVDKTKLNIQNWIDNGIMRIGHLLGPDGYMTFEQFKLMYPRVQTNFLLFHGIVSSTRRYQKELNIDLADVLHIDQPKIFLQLSKGGSKSIYKYLVYKNIPIRTQEKWCANLRTEIEFSKVFRHLMKSTQDTRLRWFQFRLLYRIIPCQRFLFLRKVVDAQTCNFCKTEEQTLEHLFWDCTTVKSFWNSFTNWLHHNFTHCRNLNLSKQLVLLGVEPNVYTDQVFDLFVLLAKQHIFLAKMNESRPNFHVYLSLLKQRLAVEKINAYKGQSENRIRFFKNWQAYANYFLTL